MGQQVESYVDEEGNTVKDGDLVNYRKDTYKIRYISHNYVNMQGVSDLSHRWLHLSFSVGVPTRVVANAPKKKETDMKLWKDMTPEEKGALLLAYHEGKVIEFKVAEEAPITEAHNDQQSKLGWHDTCFYRVKPEHKPVVVEKVQYGFVTKYWDQSGYNPMSMGFYQSASDTHKITFNIVDGVPDCNSIRMEKL